MLFSIVGQAGLPAKPLTKDPKWKVVASFRIDESHCKNLEFSSRREWVLTNGVGGFAMGTVSGINSRRYHGHLVAATEPPSGRTLVVAGVEAFAEMGGASIPLCTNQYAGAIHPEGYLHLVSFEANQSFVKWSYRGGKIQVDKLIRLAQGKNACSLEYTNQSESEITLNLRPLLAVRSYHGNFSETTSFPEAISFDDDSTSIQGENTSIWIGHEGAERSPVQGWYYRFEHVKEVERGLNSRDDLYCPCELTIQVPPKGTASIYFSTDGRTESWIAEPATQDDSLSEMLRTAASMFIVESASRSSIIAGYPWFADWGRDTMISLPGLCLATGKTNVAMAILRSYAGQMHQGLIPNRFCEDGDKPEYNTADATLWFANSIYAVLQKEWDPVFAAEMQEHLAETYNWHVKGTNHGIVCDPDDGLLYQGEEGLQLTWMDAKVGDWVVTPRHGKPIEINGLWINALRIMEWLADKLHLTSTRYAAAAEKAEAGFCQRFWCQSRGHYFDTIDPYDASLRPNQLIPIALPFGPAKGEQAIEALKVVKRELLTPFGVRTLGPGESGYRGRFEGTLRDLDSAYHQGTAWPWLLGSYVSAVLRTTRDVAEAKYALKEVSSMMTDYGLNGISEVYDGDVPQRPNGCPWQAWSLAEILRASEEIAQFSAS